MRLAEGRLLGVTVGMRLSDGGLLGWPRAGDSVGDCDGDSVAGTSEGGADMPTPSKVGRTQRFRGSFGSSIHVQSTGHHPGVASSNFMSPSVISASTFKSSDVGAWGVIDTLY
eukprot:CAMPEP_0119010928 /NCGR_PEP_ID=MMETSP1176-20130426/5348_1 /TAXON_ID=265551 /ORGANISM="Synedropsis recta cf, Strain CCMP1620" /LENGTH=112 /DNA_ID=CAMNT_0006963677 /DNA_START=114 /DNA_END=455 /DNA_ORIENTATION=+